VRVLHVVCDMRLGGAQSYVCDLVRCQLRLGLDCEVQTLFSKGPLWHELMRMRVPASCLEMRSGRDLASNIRLIRRLSAVPHDIVHVHHSNPVVSAVLRRRAARNLFTEHGGGLLAGDWRNRLVYRVFLRSYCRFIAISHAMEEVMRGCNPRIRDRLEVVHNGTDMDKLDGVRPHCGEGLPDVFNRARFRVGIVGRLVPQKGISTFLRTVAIIAQVRSDVVFPVVGDGPLRAALESEAQQLGVAHSVLFLGFRDDALALLKRFDVFLFTSNQESFGLVLTEAMAAGTPVVALNIQGAVREIVDDERDGFVVDGADVEGLAARVLALLDDQALRERIANSGRKKVRERFTIQKNAEAVVELYRQCLETR